MTNVSKNQSPERYKLKLNKLNTLIKPSKCLAQEDQMKKFFKLLKTYPELKDETNYKKLFILITELNGYIPKPDFDENDPENNASSIVSQIFSLLKMINVFSAFFAFYKIDNEIVIKMIPYMRYEFYSKNTYLCKEGDPSKKFYFLLLGKISCSKNLNKYRYFENEKEMHITYESGNYFCETDLINDRRHTFTKLCTENCHLISLDKIIFKKYIEENIIKVESEMKSFLIKFLSANLSISLTKIDRFIESHIRTIIYKKNEVIYKEGEKNNCLYLIFDGEANLIKNVSNGDYTILNNFHESIEKIVEKAKVINYEKVITGENQFQYNTQKSKKKSQNFNMNKKSIMNSNDPNKDLDLITNKTKYQIISTLSKGSIGGLEIACGISKLKYSLIACSDYVIVLKVNLLQVYPYHLYELLINLLPIFIKSEKQIHSHIKTIKFIDRNIVPIRCRKLKPSNMKEKDLFTNEENDETYKGKIKKIKEGYQTNEAGFIKLNNYNILLHKQINKLKEKLKFSIQKERKLEKYVKQFNKEQTTKLKYRGVKISHSCINIKNKEGNNSLFLNKDKKESRNKLICKLTNNNEKEAKTSKTIKKDYYTFFEKKNLSPFTRRKRCMIKSASDVFFDKEKYKELLKKSLFDNVNSKFEEIFLKCKLVKNYTLLNLINPKVALLNSSKNLFQNNRKKIDNFESKYFIRNVCVSRKKQTRSFTPNYRNKSKNNDLFLITPRKTKETSEDREGKILEERNNNENDNVEKDCQIKMSFYNTGKFDMPLAFQFQQQKDEIKDNE